MAHKIDTVVLDKTGTVTAGKPRVTRVTAQGAFAEDEVLLLAASAERYSEHPLGKAIVEAARERALTLEPASEFAAQAGHGVRARVAGHEVVVGRPGATVTIDGSVAGAIEIADTIKPEAAEAVGRLRAMGIEVWMITGDRTAMMSLPSARIGAAKMQLEEWAARKGLTRVLTAQRFSPVLRSRA